MIRGVIFDVDGILFDTEALEMRCGKIIAEKMGVYLADDLYIDSCSATNDVYENRLKKDFGENFDFAYFDREAYRLMDETIEKHGIPVKHGVYKLLAFLKEHRIKTAIASSSSKSRVSWYLAKSNLGHYFDSVCCVETVSRGKPFPDVYQSAAASVGLSTAECLAIEDSRNGIKSAAAAGCITIMIPDLTPVDEDIRSMCFRVLNSLDDVPDVIAYINQNLPIDTSSVKRNLVLDSKKQEEQSHTG